MCLLVLQNKNATIDESSLKNAYNSNEDGVGYSFVNDGKITTKKFRSYSKFLKQWLVDNEQFGSSSPFLLHFRLATHGVEQGTFNVHPFKVREGMVFAHNGIINEVDKDLKLSDTQVFNRDVLQGLKKTFLEDKHIVTLISGFIGSSKLVFLNKDKSFKIVNEGLGHWKDDVWYSNKSYEACEVVYRGCGYGWNSYSNYDGWGRVKAQATSPVKHMPAGSKSKCEWCYSMVPKLTHTDISDYYEDEEPSFIWLCDECIEYEEQNLDALTEEKDWNDSFNSDQLAVWKGGSE